ncbi:cytochrome P450 2C11-like [Ostrea edulis]|uniref:cytochrome P450 2C11-like n=1 Tax=Ostrea edulis TaxID=37623 RepID=UPI0024AEF316|nr:cytochrome P450 2C11-like [Ostrea edulis]XP_056000122.1 cytochrome P450 2C11-like [Ostrea edulis]XP_056000124.1 cytochrome P450 2C11-like [Ostrea edulis]XP_056000125.1 cytochrome P450 2C11-like [Ostrea edulis]XP_056000126.1 cytochrome P450 2C11-like [Ostrea edulis]XP_056000127.1 cytochrome P450 2C11-like [Ostrea edulis]XP_056000128.1 cytochrome P450 2C11-like [Ostrea edulis]XP_056000129.1 cytochrome P450 2C11-like [Ostrea edulis]XP_056000130.1 cytochrome P450 2C11-like [Ostrea edulis]XP
MDASVILLVIPAMILLIAYLSRSRKNVPPGPPGVPLLGNLTTLKTEDMLTVLRKFHHQYGDVFSIRLFHHHIIFIGGHRTTREFLIKKGDILGEKPYFFLGSEVFENCGVFASAGTPWKERRAFGVASLRSFGFGKRNLQTRIIEEVEYFHAEIDRYEGKPFDIKPLISNSIVNVISVLVFGKRFEFADPTFTELFQLWNKFFLTIPMQSPINLFPFLKYLPGDLFAYKDFRRRFDRIHEILNNILDEHRSTFDENNIRDFIDCFLQEQKKHNGSSENNTFTDKQLLVMISEFFAAGMETTSTAIRWGILFLMHNPEVQSRMRKEINSVITSGRFPTLEDKLELPYCEAVCFEILRLGNVAPTTAPHAVKHDVELNGYVIPKSATLYIDLYSINVDPESFSDPLTFKPDRFIDEHGQLFGTDKIGSFSLGRRVCMGESMAKMELFLFMTSLVQRYQIENERGEPLPSLEGIVGFVYSPKHYDARFIRNE